MGAREPELHAGRCAELHELCHSGDSSVFGVCEEFVVERVWYEM